MDQGFCTKSAYTKNNTPKYPSEAPGTLFKNVKKPKVFAGFWVRNLPREPKEAQEAPKKRQNPKSKYAPKNPQKCLRGKKCLKVAISLWPVFGTHFW